MATDGQLLEWNRRGLIPAPGEDAETFGRRLELLVNGEKQFREILQAQRGERADLGQFKEALERCGALWGIWPDWAFLFYSKVGLSFWHAGATLIWQEEGLSLPAIQLHPVFARQERYLGMYDREELVVHELVHAGRAAFNEHRFEEFFAYKGSTIVARRFLGPVLHSAWEAWLYLASWVVPFVIEYFVVALGSERLWRWGLLSYLFPVGITLFALGRLIWRHRTFRRALSSLQTLFHEEQRARFVLYRLRDKEIRRFSKMTPQQVYAYAKRERTRSLRWKVIWLAYFERLRP